MSGCGLFVFVPIYNSRPRFKNLNIKAPWQKKLIPGELTFLQLKRSLTTQISWIYSSSHFRTFCRSIHLLKNGRTKACTKYSLKIFQSLTHAKTSCSSLLTTQSIRQNTMLMSVSTED